MMDDTSRDYWPLWINSLRKHGMTDLAAWLLEAAGPLNILGAQVLYLGQPFVPPVANPGWHALANLLEREDEAKAFAALLKGKP
jgi:hypothetical protein